MILILKMFLPLVHILRLPLRDFPVYFQATPRFPLQLDFLPERAAGGAAELLLRVQTQEGPPARGPARPLWVLQRRESLSLLQVRSPAAPFKGSSIGRCVLGSTADVKRFKSSGRRLRSIRTETSRHANSFFPSAVRLMNRARVPPPPLTRMNRAPVPH